MIPDDEFQQILGRVTGEEKALLEAWYSLDKNAVPPEWRLKPREKGGPYEPYNGWQPVEARLQRILAAAAARLGFADDRLLAYTASATEQEIAAGALRVEDAGEHVACFFRRIEGLPEEYDPAARDFLDLDKSSRDRRSGGARAPGGVEGAARCPRAPERPHLYCPLDRRRHHHRPR